MKKPKTMDIILIILGITVYGFVGLIVWIYLLTGNIPDALCYGFFAAITGEAGFMGWIKTAKEQNKKHEWEVEEKEHQEQLAKSETQHILSEENHQGGKNGEN